MSRRALTAIAVLGLWAVGLGFLVRRELFRPDTEMFTEMGLRITPGAMFYAVMRDGSQVGFASSTIDTTEAGIAIVDVMVTDITGDAGGQRAATRSEIQLSRGMRLQGFRIEEDANGRPVQASGRAYADSLITLTSGTAASAQADTQEVRIQGPVLLPQMLPLAVALGGAPEVGRKYTLAVFDPFAAEQRTASVRIAAESLFVLHDSATVDPATRRWVGALPDTVRAWQVVDDGPRGFSGWVDAQGRTVLGTHDGELTLVRMPYAVAFENWRIDRQGRRDVTVDADAGDDMFGSALLAANVKPLGKVREMRVRVGGGDLTTFAVESPLQRMTGDTIRVVIARDSALTANYELGRLTRGLPADVQREWQQYLRAEPELETMDPDIRQLAARIRGATRDPAVLAERLTHWVHDSLEKRAFADFTSARAVLAARAGDASDHTRLFVALARSGGLPARVASGLVRVDGTFYHHTWPEAYLGDWVPVDPTLRQFPADAAHLRLQVGALDRQAELVRLIGAIDIKLLLSR